MQDGSTNVNSLVESHAAKLQSNESGENQENTEVKDPPPAGDGTPKTDPPAGGDPPKGTDYTELLKELGLESVDALKEKLKPKPADIPESPEEKEKREAVYEASLRKHAVETGAMKLDDFTILESLKGKDDQALVYDNWLKGWKEDNPDVDPAEADRLAKEEFESEYKLSSTNEKAKARGIAKIKKEAGEIRTPLENKVKAVKENYDGVRDVEVNFPEFNKKVTGIIKEFIPEKFTVTTVKDKIGDKEEDVPIEVDLSAEDRVAILQSVGKKILENEENYKLYKKGDFKALQEIAKKEAESLISSKYTGAASQKIATEFLTRGTKRGSEVGSKVPFPLNNNERQETGTGNKTESQKVIDSLTGKK